MEQQLQELSRKMDESKDTFGVALRNITYRIKLQEEITNVKGVNSKDIQKSQLR